MIWTAAAGLQPLQTYLQDELNLSLPGWQALTEVIGISDDGSVIAGNGVNADGATEAFMAKIDSSVLTTGAVTYAGSVDLFLVDPDGQRFGKDPQTGNSFSEIPGLTLTSDAGANTAAWPDIVSGEHLVYVRGCVSGNYQLSFDFLHLDNQASGADFTGELLKGGLHVYAAEISAETSGSSQFHLVYSDTDGDGVVDGSDAVPKSDLRQFIVIGHAATTVVNKVFSDGSSMNDIIKASLVGTVSQGNKVSIISQLTSEWVALGLISKEDRAALMEATKLSCR